MKKSWPLKRRTKKPGTGEKVWLVDARFMRHGRQCGRRYYYETDAEAEAAREQLREQRHGSGATAFEATGADVEELRRARAKLAEIEAKPGETLEEALAALGEARGILAPHGRSIRDAAKFLADHLEARAALTARTVDQVREELLAAKESQGVSARYLADLRTRLDAFAGEFGPRPVADVETAEVERWLAGLKVIQKGRPNHGKPLSATSRNNFRRVLGVLFEFAKERGYAAENPAAKAAKAKEIDGEVGILTVKQLADLLGHCGPELLPFVAIGAFAGLRRAEIERLDWSEVDLAEGFIEVKAKKSKTARRRLVRISANLAEWLRPVQKPGGPVVPLSPENLRAEFEETRAAAGISEWPANALRHSFASYHLAEHRDAPALALEMGHTNPDLLFQHYRQLVKPKEAKKFWKLAPGGEGKVVGIEAA